MSDKSSFWSSVPGVVTGAAGLLTGIVGLLTVSTQMGWIGGDGASTSTTTTSTVPGTPATGPDGGFTTLPPSGPGTFEVDPRSLDFVALGGRRGVVMVENTGSTPLTVGPLEVEGTGADSFEVDDADCVATILAPGRTCEVLVTTRGGGLGGRATGTLVIAAGGTTQVREVQLEASGLLG